MAAIEDSDFYLGTLALGISEKNLGNSDLAMAHIWRKDFLEASGSTNVGVLFLGPVDLPLGVKYP